MKRIDGFPPEVIEELQYYVYRLIDPRNGETFYVGKGKGNRVFSHMKAAIEDVGLDEISDKLQIIREVHTAGLEVVHVIHRHAMDEKTAFEVEAALIDAYPNSTNIMGGSHSHDYGPMHSLEIINKYASEEIEFKHKVIMINVNKSKYEKNLYDATRYAWRLSKNKAKEAEYVLAVSNGIAIGVFKPDVWLRTTKENFPGMTSNVPNRYGFIGTIADRDIENIYLRRRVPDSYRKKGAANPIRYSY